MSKVFRNMVTVFLTLGIAGAVLFCSYMGLALSGHIGHDPIPNGDNMITHVIHAKQIVLTSLDVLVVSAAVSVIALIVLVFSGLLRGAGSLVYDGEVFHARFDDRDVLHLAIQKIVSWLSLFERSPGYVRPA